MLHTIKSLAICLSIIVIFAALIGCSSVPKLDDASLIVTNTTVIDGPNGQRDGVDVVILGHRIVAVGVNAADRYVTTSQKPEVTVIDGRDLFVIPGLWDSHVHLSYTETIDYRTFFPLSIAHGVTSLRDTGGHLDKLAAAREAAEQQPLAPDLYVSGPLLDGRFRVYDGSSPFFPDLSLGLTSVKEAQVAVDSLVEAGVDFVKAYEMLEPAVFEAVIAQAAKHGLPASSHIPLSMTGQQATDAGVSEMQHLRNLEFACSENKDVLLQERRAEIAAHTGGKHSSLRSGIHKAQRSVAVGTQSKQLCQQFIEQLATQSVFQVPTLTVSRFLTRRLYAEDYWRQTFSLMPEDVANGWTERSKRLLSMQPDANALAYDAWIKSMVQRLNRANVPIIAGTDAPIAYLTPGASLHEELDMLVESGLTPLDAIAAATYNAARFLGLETKTGSIANDMHADLVILSANPLSNIRNVSKINAVVKDGELITREQLDALLELPSKIVNTP